MHLFKIKFLTNPFIFSLQVTAKNWITESCLIFGMTGHRSKFDNVEAVLKQV